MRTKNNSCVKQSDFFPLFPVFCAFLLRWKKKIKEVIISAKLLSSPPVLRS